jgi:hypothetical protein
MELPVAAAVVIEHRYPVRIADAHFEQSKI